MRDPSTRPEGHSPPRTLRSRKATARISPAARITPLPIAAKDFACSTTWRSRFVPCVRGSCFDAQRSSTATFTRATAPRRSLPVTTTRLRSQFTAQTTIRFSKHNRRWTWNYLTELPMTNICESSQTICLRFSPRSGDRFLSCGRGSLRRRQAWPSCTFDRWSTRTRRFRAARMLRTRSADRDRNVRRLRQRHQRHDRNPLQHDSHG